VVTSVDYCIVGAGPGGLQLADLLARRDASYLVLERQQQPGSFFARFPRHRKLISINKVHTGASDRERALRWDWNSLLGDGPWFTDYSQEYFPPANAMIAYLAEFAEQRALRIEYGFDVASVSRPAADFIIRSRKAEEVRARTLVVATGLSEAHVPNFPGVELAEWYGDVSVDPAAFEGKRVLIVGKGNSAFETADQIVSAATAIHLVSPRPLRLAHETKFAGDVRALNTNVIDTDRFPLQNAILDAEIRRLERVGEGYRARYAPTGTTRIEQAVYDRVIICAGFRLSTAIFEYACRPELIDGRLPALSAYWESRNVPDLFVVGTLMQARGYRRSGSAFIHGFRYNARTLDRLLAARYDGRELGFRRLPLDAEILSSTVAERAERSSALFLQAGFLVDLIVPEEEAVRYYEELPADFPIESEVGPPRWLATVGFEYREEGRLRTRLHPVLRFVEGGKAAAELHGPEDPTGDFAAGSIRSVFAAQLRELLPDLDRHGAVAGGRRGLLDALAEPTPLRLTTSRSRTIA
jgi:thioredoxin reductase